MLTLKSKTEDNPLRKQRGGLLVSKGKKKCKKTTRVAEGGKGARCSWEEGLKKWDRAVVAVIERGKKKAERKKHFKNEKQKERTLPKASRREVLSGDGGTKRRIAEKKRSLWEM